MKYAVVKWMYGNGFEDDEGTEIQGVKLFDTHEQAQAYMNDRFKEYQETYFNGEFEEVSPFKYCNCEGTGYKIRDRFVMKQESEFGIQILPISQ